MSGNKSNTRAPAPPTEALTRDQIRGAIFSAKAESEVIDFFGVQVELRQPRMGTILEARTGEVEEAAIQMLLNFAYVPGTDDKVFEAADEEGLRQLPMGPDLQRLFNTCNKLLGIDAGGLEQQVTSAMKSSTSGAPADSDDDDSDRAGEE